MDRPLDTSCYHFEVLTCLLGAMRKVPYFNEPVVPLYRGPCFYLMVEGTVIFHKYFKTDGELRYYFRLKGREKAKDFKKALEDYAIAESHT